MLAAVPSYPAIRDAAESLRAVLRQAITLSDDPALTGIEVVTRSPREVEQAAQSNVVSLWIHRVDVQPDMVNRTPRHPTPELESRRSLPLELAAHVTPMIDDPASAMLVSGRIVQTLFDHRRLADPALVGSLAATGSELFVAIATQTAYDANLVWSGLGTRMRLGVAITISGVVIDSALEPMRTHRVLSRTGTSEQILESV